MKWTNQIITVIVLIVFLHSIMSYGKAEVAHPVYNDNDPAETKNYHGNGRVQIKVYRGPSTGHGKHKFATWGYWVKQPNDDHKTYH